MWNEYSSDLQTLVNLYYKYDYIIQARHLNEKKKNKICNDIKNDIKGSGLKDEYYSLFSSAQSYEDIVSILKKALSSLEQLEEKRDEEFNTATKDFNQSLRNFLRSSDGMGISLACIDSDILLNVEGSNSVDISVRLINAQITTLFSEHTCIHWYQLRKDNGRYRYELWYYDFEDDCEERLKYTEIVFDDAVLEFKNYSIMNQFHQKPWDCLGAISHDLCYKYSVDDSLLNEQEKALLPLAGFLKNLFYCSDETIENSDEFFKIVKQYFPDDIDEFKKALNKKSPFNELLMLLNKAKYEPLWRDIYERFEASQQGRDIKFSSTFTERQRAMITKTITDVMHHNGFLGEYPDFYKPAQFKGVKLVNSYNLDYFWMNEKNVTLHIKCIENCGVFTFMCGGVAKKKNDKDDTDIFSCMFDDRGKRFIKTVECYDEEQLLNMNYVSRLATIAVKRASLKKLNKEEKDIVGSNLSISSLGCMFLFMAVMGGVLFSVGFFLVISIITLFFVLFTEVTINDYIDMVKEFPWAISALFGPLFALAMSVITIFQSRK